MQANIYKVSSSLTQITFRHTDSTSGLNISINVIVSSALLDGNSGTELLVDYALLNGNSVVHSLRDLVRELGSTS